MSGLDLQWHGLRLSARCSGALWWPAERWLIVADLHLGKSERMARRGGALLPPYDARETLRRLAAEIEALDPAVVVSLGDGFDDDVAAEGLDVASVETLWTLARGREWAWVAGNHDPAHRGTHLPGRSVAELDMGQVRLRHIALGNGPDISGHLHPVLRLAGIRHRAHLIGPRHVILPAFGSYTGGLDAGDPALSPLVEGGVAVLCAHRPLAVPLARAVQAGAGRYAAADASGVAV